MVADTDIYMHWRWSAACIGVDTELFFPSRYDSHKALAARAYCQRCPVRKQCLEMAVSNDIPDGIFGGLAPVERLRARVLAGNKRVVPRPTRAPCGTEAAWRRHALYGETADPACEQAHSIAKANRAAARRANRASGNGLAAERESA